MIPHSRLLYECDPRFGDYVYDSAIDSWSQSRAGLESRDFRLMGRGCRPLDDQVQLWFEIEQRLKEMTQSAVEAAKTLLVGAERDAFFPNELELEEVRLERNGDIILFLDFPGANDADMWPMVTFKGWDECRAEWTV